MNQIAPDRRNALERAAARGGVDGLRRSCAQMLEELREGLIAGPQKDRVGMGRGLVRKGSDVQPSETYIHTNSSIVICNFVSPKSIRYVDLNHHQIGRVIEVQWLDMLVNYDCLIIGREICSKRRQTQRRKERVLDRTPVRVCGLCERRQDKFDTHRPRSQYLRNGWGHCAVSAISAEQACDTGTAPNRRSRCLKSCTA